MATMATPKKRPGFSIKKPCGAGDKGSLNTDRKIRFSDGVKHRFFDAERERLAVEFVERFRDTGKQFMEKPLGADEVLICSVTPKLFRIMLEAEW